MKNLKLLSALFLILFQNMAVQAVEVPSDWSLAYRDRMDNDNRASNGEAIPYAKDLIKELADDLYGNSQTSAAWPYHGFLSREYVAYSKRKYDTLTKSYVYWRHTGLDMVKPKNSAVYSLTDGVVQSVYGTISDPENLAILIKESNSNRTWVYGHVAPGVKAGMKISEGQKIGTIVDQSKVWKYTHVHLTVLIVPFPLSSSNADAKKLGWGRARGVTQSEAVNIALKYTIHPLEAYAIIRNLPR